MSNKLRNIVRSFSYTLSSNLISLIVSSLIILIIPKVIGVEEYGYFQLYLFYSGYVGFLHFGFNDGIYLRYGGKNYNDLDKKMILSQFFILMLFQSLISIIIYSISVFYVVDINKLFILKMISIYLLITNIRCMFIYILQSTNKMKEYSYITIMDRVIYFFIIMIFLIYGIRVYKLMIFADLIGKFISLLYAMNYFKDIFFSGTYKFKFSLKETYYNMSIGIKLMAANIASLLIIGIVRFGIENSWDVTTFGKVSLTLNISNLIMIFINAIGLIMFPILRRTEKSKLNKIYKVMRDFLMTILLGALIIYYPFKIILLKWLPEYSDSLNYMAMVFPVCLFEGKMSLLINTYLKTLRKEKLMLKINLISVLLSIILTLINTILLKNLNFAIFSIVILLAFKCVLSEIYLAEILKIKLYKDIILEVIISLIFIITGWFINSWVTSLIYGVAYVIYIFIKKKDIFSSLKDLKILIKS